MENVLIIAFLLCGIVCGIYFVPQLVRLCKAITVTDIKGRKYNRNPYPEGD